MKVVMTGATGFIGRKLVHRLLAEGHEVVALTRNAEAARPQLPMRCGCQPWDPGRGPDRGVIQNVDTVVHLAGEGVADKPWTPSRKHAIRTSRVAGTHALVDAIAALPQETRPRALISASAIGYYGDRGDELLDEDSVPGNDFLAEVCQAWEREAFVAEQLGVRTAVVRIGVVLGKEGGALQKMLLPFRFGLGGRFGSGRQWMSWIHLEDLVRLLVAVIVNVQASGVINGVAPAPVTNAAFAAALGRALHRPAILPVPAMALRLVLGEMSTILLASQRVLPRAAEKLGCTFRYRQLTDALADLCASP